MTDNEVALIIEQGRQTHLAITTLNTKFDKHVEDSAKVIEKVDRHERYFTHAGRLGKFLGITALGALLAKLGLK